MEGHRFLVNANAPFTASGTARTTEFLEDVMIVLGRSGDGGVGHLSDLAKFWIGGLCAFGRPATGGSEDGPGVFHRDALPAGDAAFNGGEARMGLGFVGDFHGVFSVVVNVKEANPLVARSGRSLARTYFFASSSQ